MKSLSSILLLSCVFLAACGGGSGNGGMPALSGTAVVATAPPDFSSAAISLVETAEPFTAQNNLPPNDSGDMLIKSGGDHYFAVQRFGSNRFLRFEADNPNSAVYNYSTLDTGDTTESNPQLPIIVSPTKAYLPRNGSDKLWIINPSAGTEAEFKIGEIDLSHYDPDGIPQMAAGLIHQGRLYLLMQRLDDAAFLAAVRNAYVAVIDVQTDQEVETGADSENLPGIELPLRNANSIALVPGTQSLLVQAAGGGTFDFDNNFAFTPNLDGGIAQVDLNSGTASLLIDDGEPGATPFGGQIVDLQVTASDRAYFVSSTDFFGTQTLYRFDPVSGGAPQAVPVASEIRISSIASDGQGRLWIGRSEAQAPGLTVLDVSSQTESIVAPLIDTVLTPQNIDFLNAP